MIFEWDPKKNEKLKEERGVSFEEIEMIVLKKEYLHIENHTQENQIKIHFKKSGYVFCAIVEKREKNFRIVTAYKSRKLNRKYQ